VLVGVGVKVGDGVGIGVLVGVEVGIGVGVGVRVLVGVGVEVGVGVKVGIEVGVRLGVLVAVSVEEGRDVLVRVGVGVKEVQLTHNPTRKQNPMSFHAGLLTGIGFTSLVRQSHDVTIEKTIEGTVHLLPLDPSPAAPAARCYHDQVNPVVFSARLCPRGSGLGSAASTR
jgi:hypothetical protein